MKILIIGSGSFVFDDAYGPGVVLRSVVQWCSDASTDEKPITITLTYHSPERLAEKQEKSSRILKELAHLSSDIAIEFIPSSNAEDTISNGDIMACFIVVPDQYHAQYTRMCVEAACPVWLVKPLSGDLTVANNLHEFCKDKSARIWVDYHKRFDASNALLKTKLKHNELGQALIYSVDYHQPFTLPTQVFDWARDVDVFTYIGCHYVDQIFYLYPDAVLQSVHASGVKGRVYEQTGQFDCVLANIKFNVNDSLLHAPMNIGWSNPTGAPTKSLQTLKIQCEKGVVHLDQTRRGVQVWNDEGVAEINPYFFSKITDIFGQERYSGYGYESVATFLDLVLSDVAWPQKGDLPTLDEAVKTEHVLHAVQQSLQMGAEYIANDS